MLALTVYKPPLGRPDTKADIGASSGVRVADENGLDFPREMPGSRVWLFFCKVHAVLLSWLVSLPPCCSPGQTQQECGSAEAPSQHPPGGTLGPVYLSSRAGISATALTRPRSLFNSSISSWVIHHLTFFPSTLPHPPPGPFHPHFLPFFLPTSAFCKPSPALVSKWL